MMTTLGRTRVKLPSSLQEGVQAVWDVLRRGASRAELEGSVAALHRAFVAALAQGHVTQAQERVFAAHLREICAAVEQH